MFTTEKEAGMAFGIVKRTGRYSTSWDVTVDGETRIVGYRSIADALSAVAFHVESAGSAEAVQ